MADQPASASASAPSLATLAIHADDAFVTAPATDVAPAIHVSTIFHYPRDPSQLVSAAERVAAAQNGEVARQIAPLYPPHTNATPQPLPPLPYIYSRYQAPSAARLEQILAALLDGHATTYASGLAAFHALLVRVNPQRLAIGECYHGCHAVAAIFSRLTGMKLLALDTAELRPGDLVHLETPLNPYGTASSIAAHAERAHAAGALLSVDATVAPPPLQNPFCHGADYVMHSATKYLGGHSDLLGGVLVTQDAAVAALLRGERSNLGSVMGGLEAWLGLRSIRTLEVRVERQSASTTRLARWLHRLAQTDAVVGTVVREVTHASLQAQEPWLASQMPRGFGPVFAIATRTREQAKMLPSRLRYFHHTTSLGGVESLVEWRAMSDATIDPTIVRVSVGCEGWEDLRDDLERGLREVAAGVGVGVGVGVGEGH